MTNCRFINEPSRKGEGKGKGAVVDTMSISTSCFVYLFRTTANYSTQIYRLSGIFCGCRTPKSSRPATSMSKTLLRIAIALAHLQLSNVFF